MSRLWLADDGSWGSGDVVFRQMSLITAEEGEIIDNGTDLDRQELFRSWFVEEE